MSDLFTQDIDYSKDLNLLLNLLKKSTLKSIKDAKSFSEFLSTLFDNECIKNSNINLEFLKRSIDKVRIFYYLLNAELSELKFNLDFSLKLSMEVKKNEV